MSKLKFKTKYYPLIGLSVILGIFAISVIQGKKLVLKSEKEFSSNKNIEDAQAKTYSLKEIDSKTGEMRWQLTAKEGTTGDSLKSALIKDIEAEIYKNKEVVFKLTAPYGKANSSKKEIYLFGGVKAQNKNGSFLLNSSRLDLNDGTSLEAKKGFNLVLKDKGTIRGTQAFINEDQTKIKVIKLIEAVLENIILAGSEVNIDRNEKGELVNALITNGGKVILKNKDNATLVANSIKWSEGGIVEAISNVTYKSKDRTFMAGYLLLDKEGKIIAKKNVAISHGSTTCTGQELTYENNSLIIIKGNPKAFQDGKQISADKIVYDTKSGKVEALGNVKIVTQDKA